MWCERVTLWAKLSKNKKTCKEGNLKVKRVHKQYASYSLNEKKSLK